LKTLYWTKATSSDPDRNDRYAARLSVNSNFLAPLDYRITDNPRARGARRWAARLEVVGPHHQAVERSNGVCEATLEGSATDAAVLERLKKKLMASGYMEVSSKKADRKGGKVRGATRSPKRANAPKASTTSVKRVVK
jgi:hypothetical protein